MSALVTSKITAPGVYELDANAYHADPVEGGSLSSSGARTITSRCPAIFNHRRQHPEFSDEMDLGSLAHWKILGAGPEIVVIDGGNWRKKADQEARDDARARGAVAVLAKDMDKADAMAAAVAAHPIASHMFNPERGKPEQTLIWQDVESGVWCRALVDWLPHATDGRMILADYKTGRSSQPEKWAKSAVDFGYAQQDDWYSAGAKAVGLDPDPAFVFVVQETEAPYLVTVIELDAEAKAIGAHLNRQAITTYAECVAADRWPGYHDNDIKLTPLPGWYTRQFEDEI